MKNLNTFYWEKYEVPLKNKLIKSDDKRAWQFLKRTVTLPIITTKFN